MTHVGKYGPTSIVEHCCWILLFNALDNPEIVSPQRRPRRARYLEC